MPRGLVSHIQHYATHDGPGIRTTVFLKGCPLACWWCHNPETQAGRPELVRIEGRCIRCGQCAAACPQGTAAGGTACTLCGACVAACPTEARELVGRPMSAEEVLAELLRDRLFYDESGGGVTFSGGEPLLQIAFLTELLDRCGRQDLASAVDTCGFAPQRDLLAIAPRVGLFLYDLKLIDPMRHIEFTGVSNAPILENLRALGEIHDNIWVRVPLVPGVNDGPVELDALARTAAGVPGVRQVNLLPYHGTGAAKFGRLGRPYRLPGTATPSADAMQAYAAHFRQYGLKTLIGG